MIEYKSVEHNNIINIINVIMIVDHNIEYTNIEYNNILNIINNNGTSKQ